jgi:guanyl-specific ribonuclease Sa
MYIYEFWGLPANYITKAEARELGWSSKKDNLDIIAPGYTIGGDEFMNREGLLPATETRTWYECDVNRDDGKRSNERIVFSSDGLIYFSDDGFKSFVQLY